MAPNVTAICAEGLLDADGLFALMEWLAVHPQAGKVIPGAGGLRKLRWTGNGHGKGGGLRMNTETRVECEFPFPSPSLPVREGFTHGCPRR